jgi:putative AdoMet-dependent methyltransferase
LFQHTIFPEKIMITPAWQYDEMKQIGTDYENEDEVRRYDERMGAFRDRAAEVDVIVRALKLEYDHRIMEIGCGTAEFAIRAAEFCREVTAVDISPVMISYAKKKAAALDLDNITFVHAGFLTCELAGPPLNAVVTELALHHLPDFWKLVALKRIADMMVPGGMLYLRDIVFSVKLDSYEKALSFAVEDFRKVAGDETARNFERHIRQEFSTYDWIMEEMLYRAGFDIIDAAYGDHCMATYQCRKVERP